MVKLLVVEKRRVAVGAEEDGEGHSLLARAVWNKNALVVEALLFSETEPRAHFLPADQNPLRDTFRNGGDLAMVKALLGHPGLVTAEACGEAFCEALLLEKPELALAILRHDPIDLSKDPMHNGCSLLWRVYKWGNHRCMKQLLRHPVISLTATDPLWPQDNITLLHRVLMGKGDFATFELLMARPDIPKIINCLTSDGESALHLAVTRCNHDIPAELRLGSSPSEALKGYERAVVTLLNHRRWMSTPSWLSTKIAHR
jgi:hypothetical protein